MSYTICYLGFNLSKLIKYQHLNRVMKIFCLSITMPQCLTWRLIDDAQQVSLLVYVCTCREILIFYLFLF